MTATDFRWYAALTAPQDEFNTERVLRMRGFETLVPTRREWRRKSRYRLAKRVVQYPVLPRYVFVRFRPGNTFWELFETGYVRGVLAVDGRPREMTLKEMGTVADLGYSAPAAQRFMRTNREFARGEYVRIAEGPFIDHVEKVEEIDEATGRARLAVPVLGAQREVWVPLHDLEKAA